MQLNSIFVVDIQGKILYSNNAAKQLVGYKRNELKKMYFKEIIHPNNWKELDQILEELYKGKGDTKKFESFLIKSNNVNTPIELNLKIFNGKESSCYYVLIKSLSRYNKIIDELRIDYNRITSPKYELSKENIGSLINKSELQSFLDDFYTLTNVGVGIMDMKGNVLAVNSWQDICIKFHRVNPETMKNCIESDTFFIKDLKPGKYSMYKCKNNIWDLATPIMVGKKRVGTLFIGQFFFDDEEIDHEFFKKQAEKYGFNTELYLKALDKVPRFSREKINTSIDFLTKFATMISELSFSNLRLNYLLKEQENIESLLRNQKIMLINALDRSDFYKDLLIHDIANVLHNIQLSIDLLEMKEDKQLKRQNLQEIINIVINNVKKGISLVSRVRQLIKVNEKKTNKRVGLKKLINNSICNIKAQFENENKKILTELPEEVIKIKGGSLLLEAFENIMKNAIIHNDSEVKKIWIRVSKTYYKDNNWVKLEFMDNGKGIDYDRRKTIFERSIKQDKSELGMGIGLSLVKRIINGYGGIIEVQDRIKGIYQEGSNFIVLLRSK